MNKPGNPRSLRQCGAALMLGLLVAACNPDVGFTALKLSHPFTEQDPRHAWAQFVARSMEERTQGTVRIRIFPNQQLFKARQQIEGLRTNRVDLAIMAMPWLSGRVPASNLGALPGICGAPDDCLNWRGTRLWQLLADRVAKADVHMVSILWVPATYAAREHVPRSPNNLAGLTIRGMGTPLETLLERKGAAISSMSAADTFFGLQTGNLDVLFSTVSSFVGYSMQEVVKEIVIGRGFMSGGHFILMSEGARRKLSPEERRILDEVLGEAEVYFAEMAKAEIRHLAERFADDGVRLVELSDTEIAAWIEAARTYSWDYFRRTVAGGDDILAAVEEIEGRLTGDKNRSTARDQQARHADQQ